jgi:citrate lyase subunit beta/citryl-CoA lyase
MVGIAGRKGPEIRSDCWVRLESHPNGGLVIDIKSKVAAMYGRSIRTQAESLLQTFKIENCSLQIEDAGALPFVLGARIEAAIRRANPSKPFSPQTGSSPIRHPVSIPTSRERLRRSRLYLPGNEPKFMINAGLHKPDGVILDLEDAVAPSEKDAARVLVRNALCTLDFFGAERMVRINQGALGLDDLEWIVPFGVELILIPKVEEADQVRNIAGKIRSLQPSGAQSDIQLMPIIESAKGGINAYSIATATPEVAALAIGLEDYTADIGVERTVAGRESFWLRSQVVNAAKAAGVQAIDTVYSDVSDMAGLRVSALESKSLGFEGRGCIHPRQIPVVHEAFAPTSEELAKAERVVAAFKEAESKGLGVVSLGSKMIDPPVVKRALKIVAQASLMARRE